MAPRSSESAVPAGGGAGTRPPTAGVLEEMSSALVSARAGLSGFFDLVSMEARRAGLALMWMVVWGFVAAICIVAAWLGLMAALAMWAVSLGVPAVVAVIAVAAINCVAGAALIYVCFGMSGDLLFAATRRQLAGKCPAKTHAP